VTIDNSCRYFSLSKAKSDLTFKFTVMRDKTDLAVNPLVVATFSATGIVQNSLICEYLLHGCNRYLKN
jgi:hypothetical protein